MPGKTVAAVLSLLLALVAWSGPVVGQNGSSLVVYLQVGASTASNCNPCGSFASALSVAASGGNIVCLSAGNFSPAATITQSINIDCHGYNAFIFSCGNGTLAINAPGATVTIREFGSFGLGCGSTGLLVQAAAAVQLEDVVVDGFTNGVVDQRNSAGASLVIKNTTIRNNSTSGVLFTPAAAARLQVTNSLIEHNGSSGTNAGISIKPGSGIQANVTIERSAVDNNQFGIFLDGTAGGTVRGMVTDSVVSGNLLNGIAVNTGAANVGLTVDNTKVAGNNIGVAVGGTGGLILVRRSTITGNNTGLSAGGGGTLVTYRDNLLNNNTTDGAFSFAIGTQ